MLEEMIDKAIKIRLALRDAKRQHLSGAIILDLETRLDSAEGNIGAFIVEHATTFIAMERQYMYSRITIDKDEQ